MLHLHRHILHVSSLQVQCENWPVWWQSLADLCSQVLARLVRVLQRNQYKCRFIIEIGSDSYRGQQFSLPAICKLENQEASGEIQSESKGLITKGDNNKIPSPRPKVWQWCKSQSLKMWEPRALGSDGKRRWMFKLKKRGQFNSSSIFFFSIQALNRLNGAGSHWQSRLSLLSLLIQILIPSGNTSTDAPRNNVLSALWA